MCVMLRVVPRAVHVVIVVGMAGWFCLIGRAVGELVGVRCHALHRKSPIWAVVRNWHGHFPNDAQNRPRKPELAYSPGFRMLPG